MYLEMFVKCPRCQSNVLLDHGNLFCLMCGTLTDNGTGGSIELFEQQYMAEAELRNAMADRHTGIKILTGRSSFKVHKRRKW